MADILVAPRDGTKARAGGDLAPALAGLAAALLLSIAAGLPKLANAGADNDSLMRLVMIRDLLAGQGWFDPEQYRMGPEGGFPMHWSRLVDAPIALLVAAFGEKAAAFVWPGVLLAAALVPVLKLARRLGGDAARFPAVVLAVAAFHFMGIFQPGSLDHHNVQLALVLAMAAGLLAGTMRGGLGAGATAALSLAVGVETLPVVAAAGAAMALLLALDGRAWREGAAGFGLGFAVLGALALPATRAPSAWWQASCDAYSGGHAALAVVAGTGLALAALTTGGRSAAARLAALAATGAGAAAVALVLLPQCLGDPYAGLDPRLRAYWLEWVSEAQPVWSVIRSSPVQAATHYVTPLIALALVDAGIVAKERRHMRLAYGLLLAVAIAVSWWQLRGAIFALALAVPPLAAWVAGLRRAVEAGSRLGSLRLAAAWLVSFNIVWGLAAQGVAALAAPGPGSAPAAAPGHHGTACLAPADYAALAREPATTVLAISNLGAPILALTPHRALAGPYHRNEAGNLATLDALMGEAVASEGIVRRHKVGIVAICPGNEEAQVLARRAPDGLLAGLIRGETPPWLEPIAGDGPLRLFRVAGPAAP